MFHTYIKNTGAMKTIVHKNNHNKVKEVEWDADYDGDKANILIDLNNGKHEKHYQLQLDNDNLAELLSVPSVNMPLEKRLIRDFKKSRKSYHNQPIQPIYIEFDVPTPETRRIEPEIIEPYYTNNLSPYQNEIIIPIQTKTKKYRKHKKPKSYKIYKRISYTPYSKKHRKHRKHRKHKTHKKYRYTTL